MASVHAKTHQSGNQCVILYTWCSVQKLVNKVVFWYFKLITCLKNTILWDIQGMINKRPDCCNKSFMLIDTAYSSLSPSK